MPDFYDNLNNQNQNAQNQPPSIAELEMQGHMLNAQLNDPFSDYEPLFDMYPRYKNQIQEAFNRGIPRRIIEKVFNEHVEPKLNFVGTPEQVNSFLGRDEASQQRLRDYNEAKRFQAFREAFPDKSDQDISDALAVSQSNGLSPQVLLQYPEIMKKIVDGRKLHEAWYESIQRGAYNYITQNNIANVGLEYWKGNITREQAYQQEKELSKNFIEEPLNTTALNRFLEGGTKVTTQGYYTLGKGTLYGAMLGTAGGLLGNLVGDPYHGAMAGYEVGQAWGSFEELFKLQAGADMLELSKMVDENGQPIDENAVRVAALITGAITTATEMITLKEALRILPGADKLLSLGTKENVKKALFIPQVRDALAEIVIDTSEGIGWSTVHNVIETLGTKAGIPIAQFFSQQPFPKQDLRIAESVIDTIVSSFRDFSAAALPKMLGQFAGVANNARKFNSQLYKSAKELDVSPDTLRTSLEQAEIETRQLLEQEDNQPEIQQKTQPTQEIQQTEQPVQEVQPEQQTVQQENQTEQQQAQPQPKKEYDYIFLPRDDLQTFINDHSDFDDLHGITTATEIGLTQEQFDRIAEQYPDFISSVVNDIRYGSNGTTITEANRKLALTDPEVADEFHSDENQAYVQNVTQQYSDNGVEQQEANDLALLWGANRASILAREGVDIALPKINQQVIPQADISRLSPEYDINNPDTWPDRERAEKFKEAVAWGKLPDAYSYMKNMFDIFRGKNPERADELEPKNEEVFKGLKQEAPDKVKSTRNDLARQEFNDYVETLRQANIDTIQSLNLKDNPDTTRYEFNAAFPKGKSRNPTEQYYFENFDGKTRIDLATEGTSLKVRIKSAGSDNAAVFAIKNYRDTNLHQVLSDVLGGFSINGIKLSETPAAMYLSQALHSFWDKFNLRKADITTQSYSPHVDVNVEHLPVEPRTNVYTHSVIPHVDVQTSSHTPDVDSITEHYNLPDDLDTIAEDWKMQRAKPPAAFSSKFADADTIRARIKTHSTTDFDSMYQPKAESYTPKLKVNVERMTIDDMPPELRTPKPNVQRFTSENMPPELAAPVLTHEPSYYRAEEIKFNEDFVSPEFEQDNLLERDNPDYENIAPDENTQDVSSQIEQVDYSPEFNEENYSPDYEHNNAVLQDIPEQHIPDYETASPETKRENMPDAARFKLAQDEAAWHKTVDSILADDNVTTRSLKQTPVITTPLVLTLVGAHHNQMNINNGKLKLILRDHPNMTPDILKDMPRALTDPIAIFESDTRDKSIIILTDLKDINGVEVLAAVNMNQRGDINKIDSAYSKSDKKGKPKYSFYQDLAVKGNMLYLNRQKAAVWAQSSGVDLAAYDQGVKNETDLINLWNKHKEQGYYYTDKEGNPVAFTTWKYGRAVIEFLQNTHTAANVHEFGHAAFFLMQALEKQGSLGMKQDIDIILNHAGVSREAFDADTNRAKGGAREQAQEYFAKAWETYIAEGKAPTKKLQPVFNRLRKKLLEIYDDINTQLGIQLDDEIRGVFDRLLTLPGEEADTVADSVLNEIRVENQIDAYAKQQADIQAQTEETLKAQRDYELNPQDFQIDEQAADFAYNWVNEKDWVGIQDEEYQIKREQIDYIISELNNQGGISYRSLWEYIVGIPYGTKLEGRYKNLKGYAQRAHDIYNKWRRLFAKGYLPYDVAESIALRNHESYTSENLLDYNSLEEFLEDVSPVRDDDAPQMISPERKVDNNLVNAFLAGYGIDETVSYLETRKNYLEGKKNQTDEIKAELIEINEWLNRLDNSKEPFDEDIANPHKRKKHNISKHDLRRAASTGYKMGEGKERALQELKSAVREQQIQDKYEAQLQSQQDKSNAKLQAILERKAKREQALRERLAARKEKDNARFEAFKQKAKEARDADKSKQQDRLIRITQTLNDRANAKIQRIKQQAQRKLDRLQQRIDNLRAAREKRSQKAKINRLVKGIAKMSKAKNISVDKLHEINDLLQGFNLSRKGIKQRDEIRKFFDVDELPSYEQLQQNLDEYHLSREDLDAFLDTTHIEDMTLDDVANLHQQVAEIYDQGRRDFEIWKQNRDNRRADLQQKLSEPLLKLKAPDKTVVTDKDDLNKQFSKVGNMANQFWDAVKTPGRFLASLGENFRKLFEDEFTSRRDKLYTWVDMRKQSTIMKIKNLGLSLWDFAKPAITIDGKTYSWEECHAIWLAFQNENSQNAVLWGNFIQNLNGVDKLYATKDEAMSAINQIFELMHQHPEHIQAAQLIIQDFEQNFQRLHDAGVQAFNTDIQREDNYTPIHRLRYQSPQGLIDAETEKLAQSGNNAQIMQKVENGFTRSRNNISPMYQQPVDLHVWANWLDAVTEQEYYIHLAGYAADLQSAMLTRDENGNSVVDLIKSRRGVNDWNTLKSIFNDSITDKDFSEAEAVRGFTSYLLRARSFAYVPFRGVTALVQSASYLTAFPYTSHGHLFRTLVKFSEMCSQGKYKEFMENVFQKAGELRFASGDFADETYRRELMMSKSLPAGVKSIIDKYGYAGVRFVDRTTKALVFHAVYESNIENGMSEEEAVRLANRAVRDTQPASTTRESTRLNRKNGLTRLILTQFMAPLAPVFNMAVVDVARALAHPSWNNVKAAACFTISAAMTMLFSQFARDAFNRRIPNGEEDDYGNVSTWGDWILNGLAESYLGALPIFNNSFLAVYRMLNGRKFQNENRLDAPFVSLAKAAIYAFNDDYEGQYNTRAIAEFAKALALLGVPLPYAAVRDFVRLFWKQDE